MQKTLIFVGNRTPRFFGMSRGRAGIYNSQWFPGATSLMFHTVGGAASEIMGDEDFFSVYGDQSGDSMTSSMISGSTATANYTECKLPFMLGKTSKEPRELNQKPVI